MTECLIDFCKGCDNLFKPKVQSFLKANGEEWLSNLETRNYLRTYLEKQKEGCSIKSDAEEYLELFELCSTVLEDQKDINETKTEMQDLLFDEEWVSNMILLKYNF